MRKFSFEVDRLPMKKIPVTILLGPTATGKTTLSLELARRAQGEIISADSMQVYRGMDIGTGKPSPQERGEVPHHLMDILEVSESFNVGRYLELADKAAEEIFQRGRPIFLVGGTPLYIKRFIEGLSPGPPADEELRRSLEKEAKKEGVLFLYHRLTQVDPQGSLKINPQDLRRIVRALEVYTLSGTPISEFWKEEGQIRERYSFQMLAVTWPREILYERINRRVEKMFSQGWLEEVAELQKRGFSREASQALGYREILEGLEKKISLEKTMELIQRNTRHFARRQILWFRQFPGLEWVILEKEPLWSSLAQEILKKLS